MHSPVSWQSPIVIAMQLESLQSRFKGMPGRVETPILLDSQRLKDSLREFPVPRILCGGGGYI